MKRRKLLVLTTIIAASVAFTAVTGTSSKQARRAIALTPEEVANEHGRIFSTNPGAIQAALQKGTGDVYVHGGFSFSTSSPATPKRISPSEYEAFKTTVLVCDHNLVALGRIGTGTSHLALDNGFLYTDWDFQVEEVIRNNSDSPVKAGTTIIVVKNGGKLKVDGRMVYAIDDQFTDFQTGGEYLLFLDYIPKTGAYAAYRPTGFAISGSATTRLSIRQNSQTPTLDVLSRESLLKAVRAAYQTIVQNPSEYVDCNGERH